MFLALFALFPNFFCGASRARGKCPSASVYAVSTTTRAQRVFHRRCWMRKLTIKWTKPPTFDVRLDGASLAFKDGEASATVNGAEHFVSWSAWGKPNTRYEFEISLDGAVVRKSKPDARIGKKQVAFGVVTIKKGGQ
jgi:hypothetical protein